MPQALLPMLINITIAAMMVASFLTIAYLNPSIAKARWLAVCYSLGALEPIAEVGTLLGANVWWMEMIEDGGFLAGLTLVSPAISLFFGKRPRWAVSVSIVVAGLAYRWLTLDTPRGELWIALGYQGFFALGSALCTLTVWRDAPRSALNRILIADFAITSLHFLAKPFAARHWGSGANAREYAGTLYAVMSQTGTGLLLVAAGLLVLIAVLQSVVQANFVQARSDSLTGLPNRLALYERFSALMGGRQRVAPVVTIAMIDVDHFKAINDTYGHAAGDEALKAIAACLDSHRPEAAMVARIGGEEFVLLMVGADEDGALPVCEDLRLAVSLLAIAGVVPVTISIGLTVAEADEDLADTLRRADRALYDAKGAGRNRSRVAGRTEAPAQRTQLVAAG